MNKIYSEEQLKKLMSNITKLIELEKVDCSKCNYEANSYNDGLDKAKKIIEDLKDMI